MVQILFNFCSRTPEIGLGFSSSLLQAGRGLQRAKQRFSLGMLLSYFS